MSSHGRETCEERLAEKASFYSEQMCTLAFQYYFEFGGDELEAF